MAKDSGSGRTPAEQVNSCWWCGGGALQLTFKNLESIESITFQKIFSRLPLVHSFYYLDDTLISHTVGLSHKKVWHTPVHERNEEKESPSLKKCFYFLDKTSRSFSTVIQELHPELLVPIALFYLVLRGLDTVEDDMTIALEEKDPILRNFHNILEKQGWSYDGCAITEKDRELLVQFGNVTEEFTKVKPAYKTIIKDICEKMGNGMADYCKTGENNINVVNSIEDYDLYCHYVAGLVGNGLTRMFVESKLANEALASRPQLQESMGLFLQKTNIIRDVKEDLDDKRRFWPKEIWSKYVTNFEDLFKPENKTAALNCNSEMVLNSLRHADQCLFYLAGIKEQSVFNFAAIPQCMAIATLDLVFRNPDIYRKNVKITKGEACKVMMESTQNLKLVCDTFLRYTRNIHSKNTARDPNFLKISIACGKIEQFIESIFPTQNPAAVLAPGDSSKLTGRAADDAARAAHDAQKAKEAKEDTFYLILTVFGVVIFISMIMVFVAYMVGARFDLAFQELKKGNFMKIKSPEQLEALKKGEL